MNEFFNSTITKLTSNFNSESTFAYSTEHVDNHDVKRLKNKLKAMKESHAFANETCNFERAKKMEAIEKLEDEIEECCDKVD